MRFESAFPGGMKRALSIDAAIHVSAEVVSLRLDQVGREPGAPIAVQIGQRAAQRRAWNSATNSHLDGPAEWVLFRGEIELELLVEQEIRDSRVTLQRLRDSI